MAATYVTVAELRSALGIGSLYSDSVVEEVCQSSQDIVDSYLWKNEQYNNAHSSIVGFGTLYFDKPVTDIFFVGQTVTITNNGSRFNGSKTITSVSTNSITVGTSHNSVQPIHPTNPYGTVAAEKLCYIFNCASSS